MATNNISLIDLSDAPFALKTYYCYVASWVEFLRRLYGNDKLLFELGKAFQQLHSTNKMQGGQRLSNEIALNYWRGKLTLKAMADFPISANKELAPTANLWLPVQAYYAIHGIGISCISSLGQDHPTSHTAFRASFSDLCRRYLPAPFNALCSSGPSKADFKFMNLKTTPEKVARQSNLSNPKYSDNDAAIGKCLSSTRIKSLEDKYKIARKQNVNPKHKSRHLKREEKQFICGKVHDTSVVDFLYRMRIRSNYEEPDIYLFDTDVDEAKTHYERLLLLTSSIIHLLEEIIKRKIGRENFKKLRRLQ